MVKTRRSTSRPRSPARTARSSTSKASEPAIPASRKKRTPSAIQAQATRAKAKATIEGPSSDASSQQSHSHGHGSPPCIHSHLEPDEEEAEPSSNATVIFLIIVLISLQSLTVGVVLEQFPWVQANELYVGMLGVSLIGGIGLLAKEMFKWAGASVSLTACFFTMTTWSAAVDLILSMALLGKTNLLKFYLLTGEEYFKTSWGFWALFWDGTGHYVLQLYLAWALLSKRPYHIPGFFWCGSIIQSLPVLLLGAAVGQYSDEIKLATALNVPYVVVPVLILISFLGTSGQKARTATPFTSGDRAVSFVFFLAHCAAIVLALLRVMIALKSKNPVCADWYKNVEDVMTPDGDVVSTSYGFIDVQMVQYFFYFSPFHVWAAYAEGKAAFAGNAEGRSSALKEWAMVFAGAYTQAQVCYIGTAVLEFKYDKTQNDQFLWGDFNVRTNQPIEFWYLNVGLLAGVITYAFFIWDF